MTCSSSARDVSPGVHRACRTYRGLLPHANPVVLASCRSPPPVPEQVYLFPPGSASLHEFPPSCRASSLYRSLCRLTS